MQLPDGEFRQEVELAPNGGGAVISVPLEGNVSPILVQRFAADGTFAPTVAVDVSAVRPPGGKGYFNDALTFTDAGTLAIALSVPGPNDDRFRSHLLLITLAAASTTPTVQDVGVGVDGNGGVGTIDIAASGSDGATVIAGDGAKSLRVFDTAAAATGAWQRSTIAAPFVRDGQLFRRADGGLSAVWARSGTTSRSTDRLLATHRSVGGRFARPHELSKSPRARGDLDLFGAVALANDDVLVAYGNYGRGSLGDRTYALIGRP